MRKSILRSVRTSISRVFGVDQQLVGPQTDLKHDLGADSLDKIGVAIELEEEFGVDITNSDALDVQTVKDAARLVDKERK